jgi:hypothetical protein
MAGRAGGGPGGTNGWVTSDPLTGCVADPGFWGGLPVMLGGKLIRTVSFLDSSSFGGIGLLSGM